jgi:hypothetical protein
MKNLAIAFCSIVPEQYSETMQAQREKEYCGRLIQLKRILPKSYDLIIVDNTSDKIKNDNLNVFLNSCYFIKINDNEGSKNKGVGEISMLKKVLEIIDTKQYENITYITGRHLYTCPYFFERTEHLKKRALLSNPDFVFIQSGEICKSEKNGMFNDMIFSMNRETMLEYSKFSDLEYMLRSGVGSEQNLYNFIKDKSIDYEWVDWIGLIRNDWQRTGEYWNFNNFHIC